MATDRDGRFLFVANLFGQLDPVHGAVTVFRVEPDASLAEVPGSPFLTRQAIGLLSLAAYPAKSCTLPVTIALLGRSIERRAGEGHGKVRVALSAGFDADTIDVRSVTFEGAPPVRVATVAGSRDRRADLVFTFEADALDIAPGSASACIFGTLRSGRPFSGCAALGGGR